ncbi:TetR/AcrR family transcriptional regulator [Petrocella sp. FN5]|uniref:TetR/AcrR family transcriptional regulator n=1 Tax=Petrocella sp. FN5 TaxID=3032002 RepID=UPI0023DC67B5|nr:TetR/AcrR family transcriptional regulator [Petrocella sp. FN5]MDF1616899.1 TetR/AcrR family transcriptional regulator [Petrocella sp. FN5]
MPKSTFLNLSPEKRDRIIEGAKVAYTKKHYNEVTVDSIVAHADIPKGSFYQYFENKDDLYKYIFQDLGLKKSDMLLEEIRDNTHITFLELIVKLVLSGERFEEQDIMMKNLKERFLKECPQEVKQDILKELTPQTVNLFKKIIQSFVDRGVFREDLDVNMGAHLFTAVIMNVEAILMIEGVSYKEIIERICDVLELGMIKS